MPLERIPLVFSATKEIKIGGAVRYSYNANRRI